MESSSTTLNITATPEGAPNLVPDGTKSTAPIGGNGAVMHTHGPNFGRFVADCPGCLKKYPNGPPARGTVKRAKAIARLEGERATAKVEKVATAANAAVDGLLAKITLLEKKLAAAEQRPINIPADIQLPKMRNEEDPMAELVGIMLRKEAAQARKEQTQEERNATSREQMLAIEMQAVAMRKANQDACLHQKENGRTAINGQIHNDGLYHPFCQRCFKTFTPVVPRGENIQNAVQ